MSVRFSGNTIVYSKGMSRDDVISAIKKRMEKRKAEIAKREWIVKEYNSLKSKQDLDASWLSWCEAHLITSIDERKG